MLINKKWLSGIGLLVIALGLWGVYSWIYQRGFDSRQGEVNELKEQLAQYQSQYNRWIAETEIASEKLNQEQSKLIASLEEQLNEQRQRVQERQIIYRDREITKYIPVDNNTVLPIGFIWLYAHSLQGQTITDSTLYPISETTGRNPGADSGVTLSDLVEVIEQNHLRCLQYRSRLDIWNQWYQVSKENYDAALEAYRQYEIN